MTIRPVEHIRKYPPETLDRFTLMLLRDDLRRSLTTDEEIRATLTPNQLDWWDSEFGQSTRDQQEALVQIMTALRSKH